MRKFIVSDLHGNGNIYNSIMSYLENLNKEEEITLYINGDLIDRGFASAEMLIDIKNRITTKSGFNIEYLAGNHELMMYQASTGVFNGVWPPESIWFANGGYNTYADLVSLVDTGEEREIIDFISNLKVYHKFNETIDGKKIILSHAKCPGIALDDCYLRIRFDNKKLEKLLWARSEDNKEKATIGNKSYFTIVGHTSVDDEKGYIYNEEENYLNIDGGCADYVSGSTTIDHVPLVEIDGENNRLIILTFNNNNEITHGNYFSNKTSTPIEDLDIYRKYLNPNVELKKMLFYNGVALFV